jgi:hypothetical protein
VLTLAGSSLEFDNLAVTVITLTFELLGLFGIVAGVYRGAGVALTSVALDHVSVSF